MDVIAEILEIWDGNIRCGRSRHAPSSLVELAREFGLRPDESIYSEIDADAGIRVVAQILHRSLAYNVEIIPLERAVDLAARFIGLFTPAHTRYFTNGNLAGALGPLRSWSPATDATFDTGVLVLGRAEAACIWVEDED